MDRRRMLGGTLLVVFLVVTAGACVTMRGAPAPSLYKRLGGRDRIADIVDGFVDNMAADARVNARFKGMPPVAVFKLKSALADQICDATGGPCAYVGRDMRTVHTGMNVTQAEWDATVDDLVKALDKHKVGAKEQSELLGLLGPMKGDIVGR